MKQEVHALLTELKACTLRKDLRWGRKIHERALQSSNGLDMYVVTGLIKMYGKCGSMSEARHLFETLQTPDEVSWNVLLLGYAENGEGQTTLELFSRMKGRGYVPGSVTYVAALKACMLLAQKNSSEKASFLQRGREIHSEIGCHLDHCLRNTLTDMYAKCGSIPEAHRVFDSIQKPDTVSWNVLLLGYAENGDGHAVLDLFSKMKASECEPSSITFVATLKACSSLAMNDSSRGKNDCLERGRAIHSEVGCHMNHYVQNTLIDMYSKCGSMVDARSVFDNIQKPDVIAWNALLLGYAENGEEHLAVDLFSTMKGSKCLPCSITYISLLKACTNLVVKGKSEGLQLGREFHNLIPSSFFDKFVQNTLITMYSKAGSMAEAQSVFDKVKNPGTVAWTAVILGYAENGKGLLSLNLFTKMKASGCSPDSVTYAAALKGCISLAVDDAGRKVCLFHGKMIHLEIGSDMDRYLQNTLIDLYAKCFILKEARLVFESIRNPNVVSWNTLLLGYAEAGEGQAALDLFETMKSRGFVPNSATYMGFLKSCASLPTNECLEQTRNIQSEIGLHLDQYVQNTLIGTYSKCGSMEEARRVFDCMQDPDTVSWNVLLMGYAENGEAETVLRLFSRMKECGYAPNNVTYLAALKACTSLAVDADGKAHCLDRGRAIHLEIGAEMDLSVLNTLIGMYGKCGNMIEARCLFDTLQNPGVVSWNVLLLGYAESGEGHIALELFSEMKTRGCTPNSVTYLAALKSCTSLAVRAGDGRGRADCIERGRGIHSEIRFPLDRSLLNSIIDMYAKGGSMDDAHRVFDSIQHPNVVAWNILVQGYAENGDGTTALEVFSTMKSRGCVPNSVTFIAAIKACASLAMNSDGRKTKWLERGRGLHLEICSHLNPYVQNALIDMYAKCGSMVDAQDVFDNIDKPDVVSWNSLLLGYADNGEGYVSVDVFFRMKAFGCVPNAVTYLAALKACGSIGALTLGRKVHSGITQFTTQLVTCVVDFYAKCGSMVEAHEVFNMHPNKRSVSTWNALLSGYGSFGDMDSMFNFFDEMGDQGFKPDAITFVCILVCCSHAGVVEKAMNCFEEMPVQYGVTRTTMHYNCMVDILGRANRLNEALAVLRKMPCNPDAITWRAVLGACHKWRNAEIGRMAFQYLVGMNKNDASAHVFMAHIYGSSGLWEEHEQMRRIAKKLQSTTGC